LIEKNKKPSLWSCKLLNDDGSYQLSARKFPGLSRLFLRRLFFKNIDNYQESVYTAKKPVKVDWISGAFFIIKKELYSKVGGFDENIFMYLEDTDLCKRISELKS